MVRCYKNEGVISGIIGIMNYGGVNFLAVISGHQNVGTIKGAKINKVAAVKLLPFQVMIFLHFTFITAMRLYGPSPAQQCA
jgi:hypothetical protein